MKKYLSLIAASALITMATGCVSVKREEPATTRTTTVTPSPTTSVSTTTTY